MYVNTAKQKMLEGKPAFGYAMHMGSPIVAEPMARIAKNDYFLIGKMLDQGCMGIIIPMVDTAADAKAAADACRLPPQGNRSWGMGRARAYGDDYLLWADEQVYVAVQ